MIQDLPNELIDLLAQWLPNGDFFRLIRCCRSIYATLANQVSQRKLAIAEPVMKAVDGVFKYVLLCSRCRTVVIEDDSEDENDSEDEDENDSEDEDDSEADSEDDYYYNQCDVCEKSMCENCIQWCDKENGGRCLDHHACIRYECRYCSNMCCKSARCRECDRPFGKGCSKCHNCWDLPRSRSHSR